VARSVSTRRRASKLSQLRENLGALALVNKLTPELLARIDAISKPLAG
jgi:aryl-alcohol dehydrogenase-like predicted oxidoreductase